MFCKNLIIYEVKKDEVLERINNDLIETLVFVPCSPVDSVRSGFISPLDNDKLMVEINGQILLKYQTERKILPSDVINRALQEKVNKQESLLSRKLKKSEKLSLKDEVFIDLLPKAFSKYEQLNIWIDKTNKTIALTVSSFKKAEEALAHLRRELGSLSVTPFNSDESAEKHLTKWLQGDKPKCFEIDSCAVLYDVIETNSKIKLINEQIQDSLEVQSYIDGGRMVESIALQYTKGISFTINRSLTLSKIKFDSTILDKNEDFQPEERERKLEADFILVSSILAELIQTIKSGFNQGS